MRRIILKTKIISTILVITIAICSIYYINLKLNHNIDFSNLFVAVDTNNKFGIIDKQEKYVLKPSFNYIDRMSEGYARVLKDNKWGFINTKLKLEIPLKYDYAFNFSDGYAAVEKNKKWGFIDSKCNDVIALKYDWVSSFSNNIALVKENNEFYFIDKSGKNIFKKTFYYATPFSEGIAIVQLKKDNVEAINYNGNVLFSLPKGTINYVDKFTEGRLLLSYVDDKNTVKYKLIDTTNNIIADGFDNLTYYKNGIAFYGIKKDSNTKWGILNLNGGKVTDTVFNNVVINSTPYYGASITDKDGKEKYGFVDKSGKFIIKPSFDSVGMFYNNYGIVATKEGSNLKWGVIDKSGSNVIKYTYNMIYPLN